MSFKVINVNIRISNLSAKEEVFTLHENVYHLLLQTT